MEEIHQEELEEEKDQTEPIMLPAVVTDEEKSELFRELTTILSRKWIKDKTTVFGSSEMDLLLATKFDINTLRNTLEEYKRFVEIIGLELIEYDFENDKWYCLKTDYYAPSELEKNDLIILGAIISLIEANTGHVLTENIREKLVLTGKVKEYVFERSLRNLIKYGYLNRKQNEWSYNYRTLIEFGEEERKAISEEFRKI
ncbi:MAG: hypothetical protein ACFFDS_05385 [Candidatus Thorarchaeota archaeon]